MTIPGRRNGLWSADPHPGCRQGVVHRDGPSRESPRTRRPASTMTYPVTHERERDPLPSLEEASEPAAYQSIPRSRHRSSTPTGKPHIKIHMEDVVRYSQLAQQQAMQYLAKKPRGAYLYGLLAVCAILLLSNEADRIRRSTQPSFFDSAQELRAEHRASCQRDSGRRDLNASLFPTPPRSLCTGIAQGSLTASSLWKAHLDNILKASKHPKDPTGRHLGWQQALLELVGPNLLAQALRNPARTADIKRIVEIIDTRRAAMYRKFTLQDKTEDFSKAPMLQVVVFGGSVPEGTGCSNLPDEVRDYLPADFQKTIDDAIKGKDCTWPYRLQMLADAFLGKWVVAVHNLAIGGTNSRLTMPTIEYQLYQEQALIDRGGADIIINGYAVNDNLKESGTPVNTTSTSQHYDSNLDKAQQFVREALLSRPCQGERPVLLFFDDAYGSHNADIVLGDDIRADAVRLVSELYSVMHVSAVQPVKHWVQANERETVFSPNWWKGPRKNVRMTNGHYQMPGHQYAAYTLAYSMLQSLVDYCVQEEFQNGASLANEGLVPGGALLEKFPYPPRIDVHTKLSNISDAWGQEAESTLTREREYCQSANAKAQPCAFAFISNPAGTVRNAREVNTYIDRFIKNKQADNTGWTGMNDMKNGWQNKLGYVATKPGASVLLTISDIQNPVQKVIVQYLKSYGEKWSGSKAEFDLRIYESSNTGNEPVFRKGFILTGEWEEEYSISFQELLDLGDNAATIGQTVTLRITLTGGNEFKILGLMLCSR